MISIDKNLVAVLDASALLAFIKNEKGSSAVKQIIDNSIMTSVNITEVIVVLGRVNPEQLSYYHDTVNQIISNAYESDSQLSLVVSEVLIKYRKEHNISLGDGYCLALGKLLHLPIYTADSAWVGLEDKLDIDIRYIR